MLFRSLGNLNGNIHPGSNTLPSYVTEDFTNTRWDTTHRNDERIIVQSYRYNPRRVRRVYASLHYDPDRTWEISPQLLREIRNIPTLGAFLRQGDYDFNSRNNFYGKISSIAPRVMTCVGGGRFLSVTQARAWHWT